MSLRLIHTSEKLDNKQVKVYHDSQWQEFRARLFVDDAVQSSCDAFDDNKKSILGTADAMLKWAFIPTCNSLHLS